MERVAWPVLDCLLLLLVWLEIALGALTCLTLSRTTLEAWLWSAGKSSTIPLSTSSSQSLADLT